MTSGDLRADRRVGYARALIAEGDLEGALSLLEQTEELVPDWPDLHVLTGEVLARIGRRDEAVAAFRRYLDLADEDRHGALLHLALLGAAPEPAEPQTPYVEALFDDFAERFDRSLLQDLDYRGPDLAAASIRDDEPDGLGTVLDLGCGTGLVGERLRRRAHWLEGVDLSAGMLARARAKGIYDALHQADILAFLADPPRRYHRIVAADVLNYVGALEAVMAGIAGALMPGGIAVVTVEALVEDAGAGLRLQPTLRYAHGEDYVRASAETAGLVVAELRQATLRKEAGRPLASLIVTLSATAPSAETTAGIAPAPSAAGVRRTN